MTETRSKYSSDAIREEYDAYYGAGKDFSALSGADRAFVRAVAKAAGLKPGARVLDAPCGTGRYSSYFADLGYDITGSDISAEGVRIASERYPKARFVVDDLVDPGPLLEAGPYDLFFCHGFSLFNESDLAATKPFLNTVPRLLKPGGRFLFGKTSSLTDRPSKSGSRVDHSVETFRRALEATPGMTIEFCVATVPQTFPVLGAGAFSSLAGGVAKVASQTLRQPVRVYALLRRG